MTELSDIELDRVSGGAIATGTAVLIGLSAAGVALSAASFGYTVYKGETEDGGGS